MLVSSNHRAFVPVVPLCLAHSLWSILHHLTKDICQLSSRRDVPIKICPFPLFIFLLSSETDVKVWNIYLLGYIIRAFLLNAHKSPVRSDAGEVHSILAEKAASGLSGLLVTLYRPSRISWREVGRGENTLRSILIDLLSPEKLHNLPTGHYELGTKSPNTSLWGTFCT